MINTMRALEEKTTTTRLQKMEFDNSWVENKYDFFDSLNEEVVKMEVMAKFYNAPYSAKYEVVMDLEEAIGNTFERFTNIIDYSMAKSQFEKIITEKFGLPSDLLEGRYMRMLGTKKQLKKLVLTSENTDDKMSVRIAIQRITLD
jgi:hypothetical protein